MRHHRHLHAWDGVHRWTSLACTVFLLLLCVTGLPLIFRQEIDSVLQAPIRSPAHAGNQRASLDAVVQSALARYPGAKILFASQEPHDTSIWYVTVQRPAPSSRLDQAAVDAATADVLGTPRMAENGVMGFIRSLHVDLFAGQRGELFLGVMGVVFLASLVSGVVLYAPFLRHRPFGSVRRSKPRSAWLDLHNLLGIATLVWALVVGATGCINSCADLLIAHWRAQTLAQLQLRPSADSPRIGTYEAAFRHAFEQMRDEEIRFVAFPGTAFTDATHLGVYVRGRSVLRARTMNAIFSDTRDAYRPDEMPWYLKLLFLAEPLHFGNFGGLPLKLLWALYDLVTITLLTSGLILWLLKRPRQATTSAHARISPRPTP